MYIRGMTPNSQLFKGSLATIVLKLLSEQEKMYGYEITKKVKELTKGELHKLEAEGLLTASIALIGNRPRKYYSLTKNGKKEVQYKLAEFQSFLTQMQTVLNLPVALP